MSQTHKAPASSGILRMFCAFLLLISFRFIDSHCYGLLTYWLGFSALFFYHIFYLRKTAKELFLGTYIKGDSFFYHFLKGNTFTVLIGLFLSMLISASLLIFIYTVHYYYLTTLFMDIFVFAALYKGGNYYFDQHFKDRASLLVHDIFTNIANVSILLLILLVLIFSARLPTEIMPFSPDIAILVADNINHSCKLFQDIIRTVYFFDLQILSLRSLDDKVNYLYILIQVTSISLLPLVGITMVYKAAINLSFQRTKGAINDQTR